VRVTWSPLADEQVDNAIEYIAADRPSVALDWLEKLLHDVEPLAHFPDLGRVVPELQRDEIREILVAPYRVIYRRGESTVEIVALHHESREFEAMRIGL
jgi:toxin ParE1/3/4